MARTWLTVAAAALAFLLGAAPAGAFSRQDVTVTMDDGVPLAATLFLPDGAPPPGGWPAIVFLHGLAGNRQQMTAVAERYGFAGERYAVLAFDARGHGQSGGLVSIDGPREVADTRAVFDWLRARPDVADDRIGAWGISYGGGAIWNTLVSGVPWAAVEVVQTWVDLYDALVPQGLVKTGLAAGLASSIPDDRKSPGLKTVQAAAFAGTDTEAVAAWARERSSLARLRGVRTPVFLMQGRRDFLFAIDQATRAYAALQGPKRLWLGNHGHAPSTFPAVDTTAMLREGRQWFDRFLRGERNGIEARPPIVLANEGRATTRSFRALPRATTATATFTPRRTIAPGGKVVVRMRPRARRTEIFGSPTVRVSADVRGGWTRLVAVLVARAPGGKEIIVSAGGVPTSAGSRTYTIRLLDQATVVPRGARYELTLASSSTAQSTGNLLYLDLPMAAGSRLTVKRVDLRLPSLR
ncbi:MAG TPA: alpha/beta fold hydrolase [Gaiellaceae bacterium]|nr:alpha/beta fold hydrolase [Gaiellaceae bacterium]